MAQLATDVVPLTALAAVLTRRRQAQGISSAHFLFPAFNALIMHLEVTFSLAETFESFKSSPTRATTRIDDLEPPMMN
jgi:hypothetical protein